ncbi:MAG: RNA-binding protein, partial [Alphaproteobacteria bacterium]
AHRGRARSSIEPAPVRRCLASGARRPKAALLRFVIGPDRELVPDLEERLPGRGLWLSADRTMLEAARAKRLFAKAARGEARVAEDLADRIETLLAARCLRLLGLARRAGEVAAGFEKVRAWMGAGKAGLLLAACDAAANGRERIRALAPELPLIDLFSGDELGAALGRGRAVHVVVAPGALAERLMRECGRLAGFRRTENLGAEREDLGGDAPVADRPAGKQDNGST